MRRRDQRGKLVPFEVRLVECNRTQRTGGRLVTWGPVRLPHLDVAQLAESLKVDAPAHDDRSELQEIRKDPQHKLNGTINFLFENGEIRKGHVGLITRFNGLKVI